MDSGIRQERYARLRLLRTFSDLRLALHGKLWLANLLCGCLPNFWSGVVRGRLYRRIGFSVGRGVFIMGNLDLVSGLPDFYSKLSIGDGVVVGTQVVINLDAAVCLGHRVSIGPHVKIYTGTHQIGPGSNRRQPEVLSRPVVIGEGSWIGLGAMILPGVTIGRGSVVAAGAVVGSSVPPNSYVEGNPAKVVRQLPFADR